MPHAFEHWKIVRVLGKQRYLFLSLLALLFLFPLAGIIESRRAILNIVITLIVITGPLALASQRKEFAIAACLAILTYIPGWLDFLLPGDAAGVISSGAAVAFFAYLGALLFKNHLIGVQDAGTETVLAAINAYLCVGLAFAFAYVNVAFVEPGSFSGTFMDQPVVDQVEGFIYYSFVTMTTLGYGDITPNTILAGTLAYGQALIGQLYIALTIARIVGIQVAHQA